MSVCKEEGKPERACDGSMQGGGVWGVCMSGTVVVVVRVTSCCPFHIEGWEAHGQVCVMPRLGFESKNHPCWSAKCHMVF